jgi:hypothetical protein
VIISTKFDEDFTPTIGTTKSMDTATIGFFFEADILFAKAAKV